MPGNASGAPDWPSSCTPSPGVTRPLDREERDAALPKAGSVDELRELAAGDGGMVADLRAAAAHLGQA